jgi:hypothetical protein
MRRRLFAATLLGSAVGAGAVVLLGGPVVDALADPPREGFPPDPPAKANTKQWVFQIIAKQGVPSIGKITPVTLKKAEGTARVMGRYALEFYVGTEILDRLRFNVPLGAEVPRQHQVLHSHGRQLAYDAAALRRSRDRRRNGLPLAAGRNRKAAARQPRSKRRWRNS